MYKKKSSLWSRGEAYIPRGITGSKDLDTLRNSPRTGRPQWGPRPLIRPDLLQTLGSEPWSDAQAASARIVLAVASHEVQSPLGCLRHHALPWLDKKPAPTK